jgi:hypothetical protein
MMADAVRADFRAAAGAPRRTGAALDEAEARAVATYEVRCPHVELRSCFARRLLRTAAHAYARACACAWLLRAPLLQFLRRAQHQGGTERALLSQLIHRRDDTARAPSLSLSLARTHTCLVRCAPCFHAWCVCVCVCVC